MGRGPIHYSTVLPVARTGWRRSLATAGSVALHLLLLVAIVRLTTSRRQAAQTGSREAVQPIPLVFAPPPPEPTPRAPTPDVVAPVTPPPPVPLTPGPDQAPGATAPVVPAPESSPNAPSQAPRTEASRPEPSDEEAGGTTSHEGASAPAPTPATDNTPVPNAAALAPAATAQVAEARRLFGPGPSKLGPVSGSTDNRPWESQVPLASRGCTLPPQDPADSALGPSMASVHGVIYRQDNHKPLAGARLQILGSSFGTFSNDRGEYRLVFDRNLVDLCRTQSVRVTAPGYQARDVILYVGDGGNSDVPLSRY